MYSQSLLDKKFLFYFCCSRNYFALIGVVYHDVNILWISYMDFFLSHSSFFYYISKPNKKFACVQSCPTLCKPMDCSPPGSFVLGENPGTGCHFLFQGIFPTQGSKVCLLRFLHWQADSLPLCHLGSPNKV